jgi:hypothetical protein
VAHVLGIALLVFSCVVLVAALLALRAVDRRAAAREERLLALLERLARPPAPRAIDLGEGDVLHLDPQTLARLDAVREQAGPGGMDAVYGAIDRGLDVAERGFAAKRTNKPDPSRAVEPPITREPGVLRIVPPPDDDDSE